MVEHFKEVLPEESYLIMVKIPGGRFRMGSAEGEGDAEEYPQHRVQVPEFCISNTPITQKQWRVVAEGLPKVSLYLESRPSRFDDESHPVESVSWFEADEFCARLARYTGRDYRLPVEAEWEYACRAGTVTPFSWGDCLNINSANFQSIYARSIRTTPVYEYLPNPFWLYDMHGNVWEWCADRWHDNYKGAPIDGSAWEEGEDKRRVIRGGSWADDEWECRSASRLKHLPVVRNDDLGFRVCCSVPTALT